MRYSGTIQRAALTIPVAGYPCWRKHMTVKEREPEAIAKIPDEYTLDGIGYERYVIESIEQGLVELDRRDDLARERANDTLNSKRETR